MTTQEHDLASFDFTAMMTDHVGRFTVGFVGIGRDKAVSMASGTLVRYGKVAGTYGLVQARMVGVAFWEKRVDKELQILCHGQVSVHTTLQNAIVAKWP
jgi:hypothetical protein